MLRCGGRDMAIRLCSDAKSSITLIRDGESIDQIEWTASCLSMQTWLRNITTHDESMGKTHKTMKTSMT
jgi:hypothetical protein